MSDAHPAVQGKKRVLLPRMQTSDLDDSASEHAVRFREDMCSPACNITTPYADVYGCHPSTFSSFGNKGQMISCSWTAEGIDWLGLRGHFTAFGRPGVGDLVSSVQLRLLAQLEYSEEAAAEHGIIVIHQSDSSLSSPEGPAAKPVRLAIKTPKALSSSQETDCTEAKRPQLLIPSPCRHPLAAVLALGTAAALASLLRRARLRRQGWRLYFLSRGLPVCLALLGMHKLKRQQQQQQLQQCQFPEEV